MNTQKNSVNARLAAAATILFTLTILAFSQGLVTSGSQPPYDPKVPPPVSLPNAYAAVLVHIGMATNQFHCVSATCLEHTGIRGWSFTFSNTNGEMARVQYYFGAKMAYISDLKSAALLKLDKP